MNLERMQALFAEHTSDLSSAISPVEVEEYLNRAYQFSIPAEVGGEFGERIWELICVVGQSVYDYPTTVIAPKGSSPWISSYIEGGAPVSWGLHFLDVETDPGFFELTDRVGTNAQGYPYSILFYGSKATITPTPDRAYVINIPTRGTPDHITLSGLENETHAMAVITSAAVEFLARLGNVEEAAVQSQLYQQYESRLITYAQARPKKRRLRRSF